VSLAGIALLVGTPHVQPSSRSSAGAEGDARSVVPSARPEQRAFVRQVDAAPDEPPRMPKRQRSAATGCCGQRCADEPAAEGWAPNARGDLAPQPQVAHQRLTRDGELVRLDVPRADEQLPLLRQPLDRGAALGSHLQVILDDDRLPVGLEGACRGAVPSPCTGAVTAPLPSSQPAMTRSSSAPGDNGSPGTSGAIAIPMSAEHVVNPSFHHVISYHGCRGRMARPIVGRGKPGNT